MLWSKLPILAYLEAVSRGLCSILIVNVRWLLVCSYVFVLSRSVVSLDLVAVAISFVKLLRSCTSSPEAANPKATQTTPTHGIRGMLSFSKMHRVLSPLEVIFRAQVQTQSLLSVPWLVLGLVAAPPFRSLTPNPRRR